MEFAFFDKELIRQEFISFIFKGEPIRRQYSYKGHMNKVKRRILNKFSIIDELSLTKASDKRFKGEFNSIASYSFKGEIVSSFRRFYKTGQKNVKVEGQLKYTNNITTLTVDYIWGEQIWNYVFFIPLFIIFGLSTLILTNPSFLASVGIIGFILFVIIVPTKFIYIAINKQIEYFEEYLFEIEKTAGNNGS
jgi:hypothetical protein